MLLAIDTATNLAGIALLDDGELPVVRKEPAPLGAGTETEGSNRARPPVYALRYGAGASSGQYHDREEHASDEVQTSSAGGLLPRSSGSSEEQEGLPRDEQARVRAAYQWQTGRNHTVELMPNIIRLLDEAGARVEELEAVAVAIGPGSYTGLRIGLSVAKGFCLAHGAALVAVPTLDISAMLCPPRDGLLCAMLQAGRGRLAAGFYRAESGQWQRSGELFFGRAAELADACAGRATYFAGELDQATLAVLRERLAGLAEFAPAGEWKRDPRELARLGWERLRQGRQDHLETLAPAYGQ